MNISFIIYHHGSISKEELFLTIDSYKKQKFLAEGVEIEIIIMLDQIDFHVRDEVKESIQVQDEKVKVIHFGKDFMGAGPMWQKGLSLSKGEAVIFTWSGVIWNEDSLFHLQNILIGEECDAVYGMARYTETPDNSSHIEHFVGMKELGESHLSFINSISLGYMLIKREAVRRTGGMSEDKELTQIADWEFLIRVIPKIKSSTFMGHPIIITFPLSSINYQYTFKYSLDEAIRTFITKAYQQEESLPQVIFKEKTCKKSNLKIAIINNPAENAQVQLCFLNYFDLLKKEQLLTWRRFSESTVKAEELKEYDIVFFVRCKARNAFYAAKYCHEQKIKTVYLLDDNWFCITKTYPQAETQIGRNTQYYHYFTSMLAIADYVLVYNTILEEDIKKYNGAVLKLSPNVTTSHFRGGEPAEKSGVIHIGFAGSPSKKQHFGPGFKALIRVLYDYKETKLFFKGIEMPLELSRFNERVIQTPYTLDYKKYAKEVGNWQCDIMMSPLDDSRYTNSKCPNKYLEITASGAAGIYSNTNLYHTVVSNQYNGLIINNNEEEWYQAIALLIANKSLRHKMIENATRDIMKNYETKVLLPDFIQMLEFILGNKLNIY